MNLRQFDLNLLIALDVLLTERNVTRAAERLCLSQPAMSGMLARLRQAPDGHFFDIMTRGFGRMPSYASQIPVADRWAIVAYIRAGFDPSGVAVKIGDTRMGSSSMGTGQARGLVAVLENHCDLINMSYGGSSPLIA